MRKGSTSTIIFHLPSDLDMTDIADGRITICQKNEIVINHSFQYLTVNLHNHTLSYTLSQQEALLLQDKYPAEIQLKVKFIGGTVLATPIYRTTVRSILNEEVL